MPKLLLLLILSTAVHAAEFADRSIAFQTTRYDLDYRLDYDQKIVTGACRIQIKNISSDSARVVPLLLYKLMAVHSIQNLNGQELAYTQRDVMFDDRDWMQVNFIEVTLPKPLAMNASTTLDIRYDGYMQGYVETGMLYTQDSIDPYFTILRPDCYAYPEVGYPNWSVNRKAGLQPFDYVLTVTVPEGYVAANPGWLVGKGAEEGRSVFTFQNMRPAWRIDAAIAKYAVLEKKDKKIYYLPGDDDGAAQVMSAMEKCSDLYTRWFGPLHRSANFTVVEIPEGYGSQADVSGMLLTADSFKDKENLHQLYHEVSHQWNVKDTDPMPARWNEGLATFLEWLAVDQLDQPNRLDPVMDWMLGRVKEDLQKDVLAAHVAPVDFGSKQIEGMSYSVGAVAFAVLYQLVGETEFDRMIGGFYQEREASGATAREFARYIQSKSSLDLRRYLNDWWLGTGWASLAREKTRVWEVTATYRGKSPIFKDANTDTLKR